MDHACAEVVTQEHVSGDYKNSEQQLRDFIQSS